MYLVAYVRHGFEVKKAVFSIRNSEFGGEKNIRNDVSCG